MKISTKNQTPHVLVAAGFAVVSLLLLVIIALWKVNANSKDLFHAALEENQFNQQVTMQILNAAHQRALALHAMTILEDPFEKDETFIRFREYGEKLIIQRKILGESNSGEKEWEIWQGIRQTLNTGSRIQYEVIDAVEKGENAAAQHALVSRLQPLQENLQKQLGELNKVKEQDLLAQQHATQSLDGNITALMYLLGFVAAALGIATYLLISRSTSREKYTAKRARQYKALFELSLSQELPCDEQIHNTLRMTCKFLNMDLAKLCRIDARRGSARFVDVVDFRGALTGMEKNTVVPLDKTMCGISLESNEAVLLSDVQESIYKQHDYYEVGNTGCFMGIKLEVSGQVYGSLNFSNHLRRTADFTKHDREVLRLAAKSICAVLERENQIQFRIENKVRENSAREESRFFANINYELRTPLNAIIGYSELVLADHSVSDNNSREMLRKIKQSGHALLSLVDNILDLTRLEASNITVSHQEFDIMDSVNAVVESMGSIFSQTNTRFICSHYPGSIRTDKEKFQQILLNLLVNLCQYSTQTEITMKIEEQVIEQKDYIRFALSGNASSQNLASKLMGIVGENGVSQWNYGRMELGFSLCHKFTQLLGGELTVSEKSGHNTVFILSLPKFVGYEEGYASSA